jgi:hypothetical protein
MWMGCGVYLGAVSDPRYRVSGNQVLPGPYVGKES